jgi:hypothetical protein
VSAELSAIAVGPDLAALRPLLACLGRQTARERMELVVVAPASAHAEIERAAPAGVAGLRLVDWPRVDALPPARVAGIRVASAPVVAFTETHSFPEPDWAAALIARHREDCVAVGPVFVNGNPARALSWTSILLDYGRFMDRPDRRAAETSDDLPGHNSSYKRDVLAGWGDDLVELLMAESALHAGLRRRGGRLVLDPAARTRHVNVTRPRSWVRERWCSGRLYAASRSLGWARARRRAYAAAWPLIVAVRLPRLLADARRVGGRRLAARVAAPALLGLTVQSAAEAAGYLAGPGRTAHDVIDIELHRFDHLARGDVPPEPVGAPA